MRAETHRTYRVTTVIVSGDCKDLCVRGKRGYFSERHEPLIEFIVTFGHVEVVQDDRWLVAPEFVDRTDAVTRRDDVIVLEASSQLIQRIGISLDD